VLIALNTEMASESGTNLLFSAGNFLNSYLSTALVWTATPQMFPPLFEFNYSVMKLKINNLYRHHNLRVFADNNALRFGLFAV
jgi:hypothetical protein